MAVLRTMCITFASNHCVSDCVSHTQQIIAFIKTYTKFDLHCKHNECHSQTWNSNRETLSTESIEMFISEAIFPFAIRKKIIAFKEKKNHFLLFVIHFSSRADHRKFATQLFHPRNVNSFFLFIFSPFKEQ